MKYLINRRYNFKGVYSRQIILSSLLGAATIGLLGYLSQHTGYDCILPSYGATCAIIFITPASRFARPLNIFFSHIITSCIGIAVSNWWSSSWWAMVLAIGISLIVIQLSGFTHPPAAANPLLIMLEGHVGWSFVITPVLSGAVILLAAAAIYRRAYLLAGTERGNPANNWYLIGGNRAGYSTDLYYRQKIKG